METLSSGVGGGRESQGELGAQRGAATTLGHRHLYITFTHWGLLQKGNQDAEGRWEIILSKQRRPKS